MRAINQIRIKWTLLMASLLLLVLPALQAGLNMERFRRPPIGFEVALPRPVFGWPAVLTGAYPAALESFATQKIGFRMWLVRPRNQLLFSLFNKPANPEILLGKENQLFERAVVRGYLGQLRLTPEVEAAERVRQLRRLQDTLARRGKLLVFAIAPAKPSFAPELLPDSCQTSWTKPTNYDRYTSLMRAAGINLVDFGPVFQRWKVRSAHPLFAPGGTHWSGYGVTLAADTLFRFMEQRGHFQLPSVRQTGLEVTTAPRYTDNDLLRVLNLLRNPAPPALAYPTLAFDPPRPGQTRPRLLLIGDSYGWSFIAFYPYLQHLFAPKSHFWYYNNEVVWPPISGQAPGSTAVANLNLRQELVTHDVVLILFTEHNLVDFDRSFSTNAIKTFDSPR
jgi:hypothetical protein